MEKGLLVDLLYVLFKWMFNNKWTDHKLSRKDSCLEEEAVNS